jgi:hypothetical protein
LRPLEDGLRVETGPPRRQRKTEAHDLDGVPEADAQQRLDPGRPSVGPVICTEPSRVVPAF